MTAWDFDYSVGTITVGTDTLTSDKFVDDGNDYTTFTTITSNAPQDWLDDVQLYIVDDSATDHAIGWNDTITITATSFAKYKLVNTSGSDFSVDMFDSRGRPLITKFVYG